MEINEGKINSIKQRGAETEMLNVIQSKSLLDQVGLGNTRIYKETKADFNCGNFNFDWKYFNSSMLFQFFNIFVNRRSGWSEKGKKKEEVSYEKCKPIYEKNSIY